MHNHTAEYGRKVVCLICNLTIYTGMSLHSNGAQVGNNYKAYGTVQQSRSRKLLRHPASMTHKNIKNYEITCLKVLDVLSTGSVSINPDQKHCLNLIKTIQLVLQGPGINLVEQQQWYCRSQLRSSIFHNCGSGSSSGSGVAPAGCSVARKGATQLAGCGVPLIGCGVAQIGCGVPEKGAAQNNRVRHSSVRVRRSSEGCGVAG